MALTHSEINKAYEIRHQHPCLDCGKLIHRRSKRCPKCGHEAKRIFPKETFCLNCGIQITTSHKRCQPCNNARLHREKLIKYNARKAEKHHRWKGGINKQKGGYILILQPEHPRANRDGYVREHILVWEKYHSKPLPKDWIIHHLNGIKHDNKIRNLVALSSKEHFLVLQAKAKRIQELEALLNGQGQLL